LFSCRPAVTPISRNPHFQAGSDGGSEPGVPYVSRLAKLMGERIAQGDRAMGKLKKEIDKVLS